VTFKPRKHRHMKFLILFVLLSIALPAATAEPHPKWRDVWSAPFHEVTTSIFGKTHENDGYYYYDALRNTTRIERSPGSNDRYCGSVSSDDDPCTHLVRNGVRYLIWPTQNKCCLCCDAEHGCGIVSPTWLDGAQYLGVEDVDGVPCDTWDQKGLQDNIWYQTVDGAFPVKLDQKPNDLMVFDVKKFSEEPKPEEFFSVPEYCTDWCPLLTVCTIVQHNPF